MQTILWGLSWSYGSWIYNYICDQCLSPQMLRVPIPLRQGVLNTTLCDTVCQWLEAGLWYSPSTPVSSTDKTVYHNINEILLKVELNTLTPTIVWNNKCLKTKGVGTVTPSSKINVLISLGDSPVDLSLRYLSISWTSM